MDVPTPDSVWEELSLWLGKSRVQHGMTEDCWRGLNRATRAAFIGDCEEVVGDLAKPHGVSSAVIEELAVEQAQADMDRFMEDPRPCNTPACLLGDDDDAQD